MSLEQKHCESCGKLFARSKKYGARRWSVTKYCSIPCANTGKSTHGHTRGKRSPEFSTWVGIIGRCTNPNNKDFHKYGGRRIGVCRSWLDSFANFFRDMGPRPSPDHSIDRADNDGDYEPGNCRWATRQQQQRNRRVTRMVKLNGVEMPFAEAVQITGVPANTAQGRIDRAWPEDKIFDRRDHRWRE